MYYSGITNRWSTLERRIRQLYERGSRARKASWRRCFCISTLLLLWAADFCRPVRAVSTTYVRRLARVWDPWWIVANGDLSKFPRIYLFGLRSCEYSLLFSIAQNWGNPCQAPLITNQGKICPFARPLHTPYTLSLNTTCSMGFY